MTALTCHCPACTSAITPSLDRYQRAHIANELRRAIVHAALRGQDVEPLAERLRLLAGLGIDAAAPEVTA